MISFGPAGHRFDVANSQGRQKAYAAFASEFLDSIAVQCDRLARMVTQILTVSGLQRGGLGLHPKTFSVACLAHDALDALAGRATGREIVVELEALDRRVPVAVQRREPEVVEELDAGVAGRLVVDVGVEDVELALHRDLRIRAGERLDGLTLEEIDPDLHEDDLAIWRATSSRLRLSARRTCGMC
jgi:signal transduction histidine kinase